MLSLITYSFVVDVVKLECFVLFCFVLFCFPRQVFFFLLCSPGCPGTHSVDQASLELRNLPASASRVLGITPGPEAPEPPPKHAALKSEQGTLTSSESHSEAIPKRKLSSIGIQVGVPFALSSVYSVHRPACNYI